MTALAVIVLGCAFLVRDVLLLIYVSGLLAIGFSPVVRLIERQKALPIGTARFPRWLAILILYLVLIGVLTGIGFLIFPPLADQVQQFWAAFPDMQYRAQEFLIGKGLLKEHVSLTEAVKQAVPASRGGQAVGRSRRHRRRRGRTVRAADDPDPDVLHPHRIRQSSAHDAAGSPRAIARVAAASRDITIKVSAWLGGQPSLADHRRHIRDRLVGWAFFFYVLALISGVGELIPVVGPVLSAIPAIAVAASVSINKVLLVILFFVLQQQFENHVLVPKVMQRQVGVSPVTVIVALLIGGKLLGIVGAILAVPSAAILQVLFLEIVAAREKRKDQ